MRDKIVPEVLAGKKFVCLAITEAFAGSDVAGLKCSAKRVADGWVVNGTYKILPSLLRRHLTLFFVQEGQLLSLRLSNQIKIERNSFRNGSQTGHMPIILPLAAGRIKEAW